MHLRLLRASPWQASNKPETCFIERKALFASLPKTRWRLRGPPIEKGEPDQLGVSGVC